MDLRISHVERLKSPFSPFHPKKITLKSIELIHVFAIVGIVPIVQKNTYRLYIKKKKKFTRLDLVIWSWPHLLQSNLR